nr:uncharacterized protein LOC127310315 [Lolium perenne]
MFNCHINVEICSSIKAVKYLFKYIYKGHDRASVSVSEKLNEAEIDEIRQYRDARWVTPPEALWRIYGFQLSKIHPSVLQLQLHLPNMHMVSYNGKENINNVISREGADRSMLTAYFEANNLNVKARGIIYRDFSEYYTWQTKGKFWQERTRKGILQVGRIVAAHPAEGERYYLRVLLNHVPGATSYEDLKTVDGQLMQNFREAAEKRGLIEADNTLDDCMTEAELFRMPSSLRRLFATILVFCEPSDVRGLWNNHLEAISEDYSRNCKCKHTVEQMVLKHIRDILQSMGKEIQSFPLPEIDEQHDTTDDVPREMTEELSIEVNVEDRSLHGSLNKEQRAAYDEILATIDSQRGGIFFVDGPGGTGKTFLYRALLATIRGQGKIALATATSGVAASIMPGGRTAHSRFKIPLRIDEGAICGFTKQSGTAKLLQVASLIIWDEASMTKSQAVEALDRSMRDIMDRPDLPFGGKTVVFGGDFRQVLPVVRKGTRAQIVDASLTRSDLWKCMRQMKLVRNMRAQNDPGFAEYLLRIGNGTEKTNEDGEILLPTSICVPNNHNGLDKLIDHIYRTPGSSLEDPKYITSRAILATKNDCVDKINLKMIDRFQGEEMVYYSFDSVEEDPYGYYPEDFLNALTPNGLPPHMLKLKINCPIILLRNIDPANGLCNGTRLVVRGFQKNAIDAEIVLGQHSGMRVFLPRIPLCPSDEEMFPFRFKRKQFPVRLSFAMTINKSQGQTIPNVGIYLPEPVFSHGQLYVALSRATATSNIKVLIGTCEEENENTKEEKKKVNQKKNKKMEISTSETYTKNIVYTERHCVDASSQARQRLAPRRRFGSLRHVNGDVSLAERPPLTSANEGRCFEFLLRIDGDPLGIKRLPDKFIEFVDGVKPAHLQLQEPRAENGTVHTSRAYRAPRVAGARPARLPSSASLPLPETLRPGPRRELTIQPSAAAPGRSCHLDSTIGDGGARWGLGTGGEKGSGRIHTDGSGPSGGSGLRRRRWQREAGRIGSGDRAKIRGANRNIDGVRLSLCGRASR